MVPGRKGNDDTGVCPTAYQAVRPPRHEPQGDTTKARRIAHDRSQVRHHGDYSPRPSYTARPGRSLVDDGYAAVVDGWLTVDWQQQCCQSGDYFHLCAHSDFRVQAVIKTVHHQADIADNQHRPLSLQPHL